MLKVQAPTYSLIKLKHLHHQYSRSSNTGQSATSPSSQIFLPREVRLQQQQYRLVELKAEVAACGDTSPQHARLHIFLTGNSRRHNGGRHFSKQLVDGLYPLRQTASELLCVSRGHEGRLVSQLVFNIPFQHKYMAISGTKGQGWRAILTHYPIQKGSDILTSTRCCTVYGSCEQNHAHTRAVLSVVFIVSVLRFLFHFSSLGLLSCILCSLFHVYSVVCV